MTLRRVPVIRAWSACPGADPHQPSASPMVLDTASGHTAWVLCSAATAKTTQALAQPAAPWPTACAPSEVHPAPASMVRGCGGAKNRNRLPRPWHFHPNRPSSIAFAALRQHALWLRRWRSVAALISNPQPHEPPSASTPAVDDPASNRRHTSSAATSEPRRCAPTAAVSHRPRGCGHRRIPARRSALSVFNRLEGFCRRCRSTDQLGQARDRGRRSR